VVEISRQQLGEQAARAVGEHLEAVATLAETEIAAMVSIAEVFARAIKSDRTVWLCGNGGSAADAEHVMAEFVGRFVDKSSGWRAISLTANAATLTSLANDFGYRQVFARQLEALAKSGDVLVAISTSGESANVLDAVDSARRMGLETVAVVGGGGGAVAAKADRVFAAPSSNTQRIQEMHILFWHVVCELLLVKTSPSGA
jgi:D-sedoheptulose 7-phosphate isomerase